MDTRTSEFNHEAPVRTRGGSRAEVLHALPTHLLTQWYDGVRWHMSEHNLDGSYGMKEVPKWLEGRQGNGAEIFGAVQPKQPRALDLTNIQDNDITPLVA